jgi:hypothetical protein
MHTGSRFSPHPLSTTARYQQRNKSPEPGQKEVRFGVEEDEEDDSQDEIGDEDGESKISKPPGEPGRPKSGGYKLEDILGWNEATFDAVRVSISLETHPCSMLITYRITSMHLRRKNWIWRRVIDTNHQTTFKPYARWRVMRTQFSKTTRISGRYWTY